MRWLEFAGLTALAMGTAAVMGMAWFLASATKDDIEWYD